MTILQRPRQSGDARASSGWHRFGYGDQAVRHTEAWEHETFAEEQARWERSDPEYARICDEVRQAKDRGEEASRRADDAKAEWDARVATQRQANDDAQRAHHALNARAEGQTPAGELAGSSQRRKSRSVKSNRTPRLVIRAREGHHHMHAIFGIESNDTPAPGIMLKPVGVRDEPAATTGSRGDRQAARLRFRGPATRNW